MRPVRANLVPVSVELGGKSPFIVCADADLDAAAQTVAMQYLNAGQVCLAGTRVLVEASIAEPFLAKVRQAAAAMVVGDPREPGTRVGPLITPEHFERVRGFVERALADGAVALWGGRPHGAGAQYFEPTLLADVRADMEIAQREVFGPVLTWQTFGRRRGSRDVGERHALRLGGGDLHARRAARAAPRVAAWSRERSG